MRRMVSENQFNSKIGEDRLSKTAVSNKIPVYGTDGALKVGTPLAQGDATTKKYVDDALGNAGFGYAEVASYGAPYVPPFNHGIIALNGLYSAGDVYVGLDAMPDGVIDLTFRADGPVDTTMIRFGKLLGDLNLFKFEVEAINTAGESYAPVVEVAAFDPLHPEDPEDTEGYILLNNFFSTIGSEVFTIQLKGVLNERYGSKEFAGTVTVKCADVYGQSGGNTSQFKKSIMLVN